VLPGEYGRHPAEAEVFDGRDDRQILAGHRAAGQKP